jgi:hypothetical protein
VIGWAHELANYAVLLTNHLKTLPIQDFPGIIEYQVTEPLGTWITSNPTGDFQAEMVRRCDEFFAKGESFKAFKRSREESASSSV